MKIGILTLTLHNNYGGILQSYALQTVLERMGNEVEVLNRPFIYRKTKWSQIPKRIIKKILGRDVIIFKECKYNKEAPIINKAVWDFRKKYIHERIINSFRDIKEDDYDCIIVGSDQVWRPKYFKSQWNTKFEDAFLHFTLGWKIRRIAYAASLGVGNWELTNNETTNCKAVITQFDGITVREESSISLLNQHLGINVKTALDPTLLLNEDDYLKLVNNGCIPKSNGNMLVYLLNIDKRKIDLIDRVAKDRNLVPFSVNNKFVCIPNSIQSSSLPSVESWIRGFCDAEFVITDSFHACVFSIIFQKPFVAIANYTRGVNRFTSLLKKYSLNQNLIYDVNEYKSGESYKYDTKMVEFMLSKERKVSLEFLKNSLNQK